MSARAELSSVATDLDGLLGRLASVSEEIGGAELDRIGADIYEVERMLNAARRHLARILDAGR